ncbi:MAG: DUF493 domain-containing protein [Gammaproteobacteria bacterium]|jgi:hypothetical protein|nr:DUF493 domain-containing protein [Gammaproteobacteria bacterium]
MKSENEPETESPLKFPCRFPIKVMGLHAGDFQALVVTLVSEQAGTTVTAADISSRPSRNGRYLAVTVTIDAESRAQLDGIYRALTASERVLIVL